MENNPIKTCSRCLYTSQHPLGLVIDNEGVCSGCRIHEEKNFLDWSLRWDDLNSLVSQYRVHNGSTYDCIVPITGASDSYFILDIVKNKLKLNPLLVTYNKYFNTPIGIWNLSNLRIKFDCDILIQNINPERVRNITRTTLREFGSIYWPCIAGQTVFPVQTAVRYKIPLIIWGAHQGVEQVGMFSHLHEAEMTRRYRKNHDLMGYEADDLLSIFDTLNVDDIWQYRYPDDDTLESIGVRGIYLSNYVRWDPKAQHEKMIELYGYKTCRFERTFDNYEHVDCYNYMGIHDYLKMIKTGYSRVTDHACREIRHGRLSRIQAQRLVSWYQNKPIPFQDLFYNWIGMNERSFNFVANQHRNKQFWHEAQPGSWQYNGALTDVTKLDDFINFVCTDEMSCGDSERYITIGKGYP